MGQAAEKEFAFLLSAEVDRIFESAILDTYLQAGIPFGTERRSLDTWGVPEDVLREAIRYVDNMDLIGMFARQASILHRCSIPKSVTFLRANYGLPVRRCPELDSQPALELQLYVSGGEQEYCSGQIINSGQKKDSIISFEKIPMVRREILN